MNWKPISENDLLTLIQSSLEDMDEESRVKFARLQIPIRQVSCKRSDLYKNDSLFVLAQSGSKVLAFDDVEDEFGIATLGQENTVQSWNLYGSMADALKNLS